MPGEPTAPPRIAPHVRRAAVLVMLAALVPEAMVNCWMPSLPAISIVSEVPDSVLPLAPADR